ncbi:MAG: O-antigen ligase family protein [Porphyrobacter sp.]|nr:O-antigen ligase family protein [Porphyrobacter sp.]
MSYPAPNMPAAPVRQTPPMPQMPPPAMIKARPLSTLIPLLVVYYSFLLLPPEAEFSIYGVSLPAYRQAVLLMSVPAFWMISGSRKAALNQIDIAIIFISFWMMLSFMTIYGVESGFVRGAGIVIDTGLSFMVARACIKTPDELRRFLLLALPGVLFAGGMLVLESFSGKLLLRPFFASIFGSLTSYAGGEVTGTIQLDQEYRLGLLRAYGPFSHPILAGAVMIGFLPLYYFSGLRSWPYVLGIAVALTGFFSLSSAAFLALIVAVGAITVYHVKPLFPRISWWTIVSMLGVFVTAVHVSAQNGIIPIIARLTLTPHTADYRRLIWEFGSISVAKNPWFGIGYKQWERARWMFGDSVDAHFLLLAMRHGLIVPVLLLAAIFYGVVRLGLAMPRLTQRERTLLIGVNMTMAVYLIVGQTVNYFGSTGLVFMTMVAILASMLSWAEAELRRQNQFRLMANRMRIYGMMQQA